MPPSDVCASLLSNLPADAPAPRVASDGDRVRLRWEHGLRVDVDATGRIRLVDRDAKLDTEATDPRVAADLVVESLRAYASKPIPRLVAHVLDILPCSPQSMAATAALGVGTAMIAGTVAYGATGEQTASVDLVVPGAAALGGGGAMYVVARILRVLELMVGAFNGGVDAVGRVTGVADRWTRMAEEGKLPHLHVNVHHTSKD